MKEQRQGVGDYLIALTIMGRILISVPIIVSLIASLLSLFGANPVDNENIFAGGAMIFFCGAATLIYVAAKRFRQGLRGVE
jgi:hypothetical protein